MIWLRNFVHALRRFFTASLLSLLGLAVAFGAFFVIMTQVDYDYSFDKCFDGYENIVRVEACVGNDNERQAYLCRPVADIISSSSPHVVGAMLVEGWQMTVKEVWAQDRCHDNVMVRFGFGDFLSILRPEMLVGSTGVLPLGKAVIPASLARRFFGRVDCVGEVFQLGQDQDEAAARSYEVGGVYRDFPSNSTFGNCIYVCENHKVEERSRNDWTTWNYHLYLRLDRADAIDDVMSAAWLKLQKDGDPGYVSGTPEELQNNMLRYTPLADVHFSPVGGADCASRSTMWLLVAISIVVVLVAAINFTNFCLAETPMRIRGINTRKVLGASAGSLRFGLVLESVAMCALAFVLSVVLVRALGGVLSQSIVEGVLSFSSHWRLLCVTASLALAVGCLAGLYPAFYATSIPPALALKGSFGLSRSGRALRTGLLCLQFVVASALMVCSCVLFCQRDHIHNAEYGIDKDAVVVGEASARVRESGEAVRASLKTIPGVDDVSFSFFRIGGDEYQRWGRGDADRRVEFYCLACDWRYLRTLGVKVTEGRDFLETDNGAYIFNEAARAKYPWLTVGRPLTEAGDASDNQLVVGFCENVRFRSMRYGVEQPMAFFIYPSSWCMGLGWFVNIRLSAGADREATMAALRDGLERFSPHDDPALSFLDDTLDLVYRRELRTSNQVGVFCAIAMILCLMGVLCLTMFEVEYRRKEIGVRKVLGGTVADVVLMFCRRYAILLSCCFLVGAPLGCALGAHWLGGFVDRAPLSPIVFVVSFVLVAGLSLAAVAFMVWRAASSNPVDALKE